MIDTHAHLYLCKDSEDNIIDRARQAGVGHIINIGIDIATSQKVLATSKNHESVSAAMGIHPLSPEDFDNYDIFEQEIIQNQSDIVAIGEIGLDYKYDGDKDAQIKIFKRQLDLAKQLNKPAIIHNRQSKADIMATLKEHPGIKFVIHCYSEDKEMALEIMEMGGLISLTGLITYNNDENVIEAIKAVPLTHMMIETDTPYLTPKIYKPQKNEPSFVGEVAKRIAEIKQCDVEEVKIQTSITAKAFFGL